MSCFPGGCFSSSGRKKETTLLKGHVNNERTPCVCLVLCFVSFCLLEQKSHGRNTNTELSPSGCFRGTDRSDTCGLLGAPQQRVGLPLCTERPPPTRQGPSPLRGDRLEGPREVVGETRLGGRGGLAPWYGGGHSGVLSASLDASARDHGQARERCPDTRSASTFLLDVQPPERRETRAVTPGPHLRCFGEQPKGANTLTRSSFHSAHVTAPPRAGGQGALQAQGRDAGADKSGPAPLRPRRSEGRLP